MHRLHADIASDESKGESTYTDSDPSTSDEENHDDKMAATPAPAMGDGKAAVNAMMAAATPAPAMEVGKAAVEAVGAAGAALAAAMEDGTAAVKAIATRYRDIPEGLSIVPVWVPELEVPVARDAMKSESDDVSSHARHVVEMETMYYLFGKIWPLVGRWLTEQRRAMSQVVLQRRLKCIIRTPFHRWTVWRRAYDSDSSGPDMPPPALVSSSSESERQGALLSSSSESESD